MTFLLYVGTNEYSLKNEDCLLKMHPDNFNEEFFILEGTLNFLKILKNGYDKLFGKAVDEFNKKNPKKKILDYYTKINESNRETLATGLMLKTKDDLILGFSEKEKIELGRHQLKIIKENLKFYHIVSAVLYTNRDVLTLRVIGIPFIAENDFKLAVRVSKSNSFSQENIDVLRNELNFYTKRNLIEKIYLKLPEKTETLFNYKNLKIFD